MKQVHRNYGPRPELARFEACERVAGRGAGCRSGELVCRNGASGQCPSPKVRPLGRGGTGRPMNWDALGAIGGVAGEVAVFVTLVYLSIPIRYSSRHRVATPPHR